MPIPMLLAAALVAATPRCNTEVATQLQDQVRAYSTNPPSAASEIDIRITNLAGIVQKADAERDIVTHVCPNATDLAPIDSELQAVSAWAMEQQADALRSAFAVACPAAADPAAAGFLAAGWRRLVLATPADNPDKTSALVGKLTPLFRQQAAALKLDLPDPKDSTDYWVQTVQQQGNAAIKACPTSP